MIRERIFGSEQEKDELLLLRLQDQYKSAEKQRENLERTRKKAWNQLKESRKEGDIVQSERIATNIALIDKSSNVAVYFGDAINLLKTAHQLNMMNKEFRSLGQEILKALKKNKPNENIIHMVAKLKSSLRSEIEAISDSPSSLTEDIVTEDDINIILSKVDAELAVPMTETVDNTSQVGTGS